jgi:hypothetical protein
MLLSGIRDRALTLVLMAMFLLLLAGQVLTGHHEYNATQKDHGQAAVAITGDWLAVYLRQRWSPESKPVHAPHHETGH